MEYILENDKLKATFRNKSAELISLIRKADKIGRASCRERV